MRQHDKTIGEALRELDLLKPVPLSKKEWMERWTEANEEQSEGRFNRKAPRVHYNGKGDDTTILS